MPGGGKSLGAGRTSLPGARERGCLGAGTGRGGDGLGLEQVFQQGIKPLKHRARRGSGLKREEDLVKGNSNSEKCVGWWHCQPVRGRQGVQSSGERSG